MHFLCGLTQIETADLERSEHGVCPHMTVTIL